MIDCDVRQGSGTIFRDMTGCLQPVYMPLAGNGIVYLGLTESWKTAVEWIDAAAELDCGGECFRAALADSVTYGIRKPPKRPSSKARKQRRRV